MLVRWMPFISTPLWWIDTHDRTILWTLFFLLHLVMWIIIYSSCLTMDFAEMVGLKQVCGLT